MAGASAQALGRPREALQALERAATLLRPEVDTSRSPDLAELLTMLAIAAERAGQPQQAADARREARAIAAAGRRV